MSVLHWETRPHGGSPRWHLDGEPIHAGSAVELRGTDGAWHHARFESSSAGRVLLLYIVGPDGFAYQRCIANANADAYDEDLRLDVAMRWPEARG